VLVCSVVGGLTAVCCVQSPSAHLVSGIDDLFLVHETVKNSLGFPAPLTVEIYGWIVLGLFHSGRRELGSLHLTVVVAAVILLAVSVGMDFAGEAGLPTPPLSAIVEDAAKFVGITLWATFAALEARRAIATSQWHEFDAVEEADYPSSSRQLV
jgi:hypothetical protein